MVSRALSDHQLLREEQRERLIALRRRPDQVDRTALGALAELLAVQRRSEDVRGYSFLLARSRAQLGLLREVVRSARDPLRSDAVRMASQFAQFAGWLNVAADTPAAAKRYFALAAELAAVTDDLQMRATAWSMAGYVLCGQGELGHGLALTEPVAGHSGVTPGTRAMASQQLARMFALMGKKSECDRHLDVAQDQLDRSQLHREDEPAWLYYYSSAHLHMQRARAYYHLELYASAAEVMDEALASVPQQIRSAHWVAQYHSILASARRLS